MLSTTNSSPRLTLKLSEVAAQIGICTRTVQRMVYRGQFPPPTVKAGKLPLWSPEVIQAWSRGEWRPEAGNATKSGRRKKTATAR
jgi:predicted DNA-binding transcriptional regulator AlpA